MSVHRSKRGVAFSEFERQMIALCRYTKDRLDVLPVRYRKFVSARIYDATNEALKCLVLANEQRANTALGQEKRQMLFRRAVALLTSKEMQKALLCVWNLRGIDEDSIGVWTKKINNEVGLIYRAAKWSLEGMRVIYPLPKRKMDKLDFLGKMGALQKFTYQKIGHAPQCCADSISTQIADYVDTALYEIVTANLGIPQTAKEAADRAEHLKNAIDNLNGLQRPLYALWCLEDYSENTMDEWAGLINDELKLLEGLLKADKNRYANLK